VSFLCAQVTKYPTPNPTVQRIEDLTHEAKTSLSERLSPLSQWRERLLTRVMSSFDCRVCA
jgi:hypothetical protein